MAPVAPPRTASPVMVGREQELHALTALVATLRPGAPAVAIVSGRAGLGKTRLLAEATGRWRDLGAQVLLGCCVPAGPPYTALASALRQALPSAAPVIRMLAAEQRATRQELFDGLSAALAAVGARSPALLVVEDLHWSDRATRDAVAYAVTQPSAGRWGLVTTHRHDGPVPEKELLSFADVLERRRTTRISLEPLDPAGVSAQVTAITGVTPAPEEAAALHRRSGGIPLLVEELVAAGDSGVPDHLRSIFHARVAEQGDDVVEALRVVAVAESCDEIVVGEALGRKADQVAGALRRARDADLVTVDTAGYRFRHDLLREAVYDDTPPGRRRELHRLVGEVLSRRPDTDPAVLAAHWHEAGVPARAARSGVAAAEQADRLHAPASVHEHLEQVLQLWPVLSPGTRASCGPHDELLRRAARAAELAGGFARAASLTEERLAVARDGPADQALRWERLARYRWEGGDGHGSRAAYEEAVRVLPPDAPAQVRATVVSGLAWHLAATFDYDRAQALADEAMAACEGVDDASVRWQVHLAAGIARLGTEEGHRALDESCRLATALAAGDLMAISRMWLNFSIQQLGLIDRREPNLRTGLRAAAAAGLGRSLEGALRYMLAELMLETGRWQEAGAAIQENLRVGVQGVPALFTWGYRARLAALGGDHAVLAESLARTRALAELAPQQPLPLATALTGQAESLLWAGQPESAIDAASDAMRLGSVDSFVHGEALAVRCRAEADLAAWNVVHGRAIDHRAQDELSRQVGEQEHRGLPRLAALVTTSRAELIRATGARTAQPWRAAVSAWTVADDPYQEACAQWRLAWALLNSRTGRVEAAALLARARGVAVRLDARPLLAAVDGLALRARLRLEGAPAGTATSRAPVALTPREAEILPMLAAGRTNAEIADLIVISPRTVGVHVSRILHKLGASRRAEVGDLARQAGLLG